MNENMKRIEEESKKLGLSIQLCREVTAYFLEATEGTNPKVVLAMLSTIVKEYSESKGLEPMEFVKDLEHCVRLMDNYKYFD